MLRPPVAGRREESLALQGELIRVEELSLVLFECRSLEHLLSHEIIPLGGEPDSSDPTDEVRYVFGQVPR